MIIAQTLLETLDQHATLSKEEFLVAREGNGACAGRHIEVPQMTIDGTLAIIPVGGPIGIRFRRIEKGAGAVDVLDISETTSTTAEANDDVENIVLNCDTRRNGDRHTRACSKDSATLKSRFTPTRAGTMASGGFYIGASTDGIFTSPTARVRETSEFSPRS
jgi:hypothetical protein